MTLYSWLTLQVQSRPNSWDILRIQVGVGANVISRTVSRVTALPALFTPIVRLALVWCISSNSGLSWCKRYFQSSESSHSTPSSLHSHRPPGTCAGYLIHVRVDTNVISGAVSRVTALPTVFTPIVRLAFVWCISSSVFWENSSKVWKNKYNTRLLLLTPCFPSITPYFPSTKIANKGSKRVENTGVHRRHR